MTSTLRSQPAQLLTAIVKWPLVFHALLSLCLGAVIYVFFRQHLAIFIPDWFVDIHSQFQPDHVIPAILTHSLPSFFHMYALMLASHALCVKPARNKTNYFRELLAFPSVACFLIGFSLEIVQHPVLKPGLTHLSHTYSNTVPLLSGAAGYGAQGTYDSIDMLFIGTAGLLAMMHVHWLSKKTTGTNDEISPFHKQLIFNGDN